VESSSSDIENNNNSYNKDIEIILAVLESGNSVELPATGYSMFPTLRPGDRVIVNPLETVEIPVPGSVVVLIENGIAAQWRNGSMSKLVLVMHRLIEITHNDTGILTFITRGDSMTGNDKPCPQQKLIGIADSYKRGRREFPVRIFVPGIWRYKFNRRILWLYNKIERLKGI
jgi:signal peptidase I